MNQKLRDASCVLENKRKYPVTAATTNKKGVKSFLVLQFGKIYKVLKCQIIDLSV